MSQYRLSYEVRPPQRFTKEATMFKTLHILAAVCLIGSGSVAIAATKAPTPRISMAAAKAMALKLAPGKILSSEYENEKGAWRYSFDIQQRGHVQEIGIDGQTGKIVENKSEGKVDSD